MLRACSVKPHARSWKRSKAAHRQHPNMPIGDSCGASRTKFELCPWPSPVRLRGNHLWALVRSDRLSSGDERETPRGRPLASPNGRPAAGVTEPDSPSHRETSQVPLFKQHAGSLALTARTICSTRAGLAVQNRPRPAGQPRLQSPSAIAREPASLYHQSRFLLRKELLHAGPRD